MTLRCAFCSKPDEVDAVCHHCGRPLCASDKCRFAKEPDGDFSGRVKAYHCRVTALSSIAVDSSRDAANGTKSRPFS